MSDFPPYDREVSLLIDQIEDLIARLDTYPGVCWTSDDIGALWCAIHRLEEIDPNKEEAS